MKRICLTLAVVLASAASSSAQTFSGLYVFGDSLSDVGNVATATLGFLPGAGYDPLRFSNGPLWTEYLADALQLDRPTPSLLGGSSYAFGGATSGQGLIPPGIPTIGAQVTQYVGAGPADATGLHVLWVGANDVIGSEATFEAAAYGQNVAGHLATLYAAGARQFLVPNVPALGLLPTYNDDATLGDTATAATVDLNVALAATLNAFAAANPDATLFRLDVAGLFDDLVADPTRFGLVNVTTPAFDQDSRLPLTDVPDTFLFWDETHPTTAAHRLLALEAAAVIPEPTVLCAIIVGGGLVMRRRVA